MGVSPSTLRQLIKEEFQRVACDKSYLTLDEIQQYHIRNLGADIDPEHIGVLFDLDRHKDGRFRLEDLQLFATHWNHVGKDAQPHELQATIHSVCIGHFWRSIQHDDGLDAAVCWLLELLKNNHSAAPPEIDATEASANWDTEPLPAHSLESNTATSGGALRSEDTSNAPRRFEDVGATLYIHESSLLGLHRILGHHGADERATAQLDNALQRLAEDHGMLELSRPELDDWLPEPVLRDYCARVLRDCRKLLTNLDLYDTVLLQERAPGDSVLHDMVADPSLSLGRLAL